MRVTVLDEACCFVIIEIQWKFLLWHHFAVYNSWNPGLFVREIFYLLFFFIIEKFPVLQYTFCQKK